MAFWRATELAHRRVRAVLQAGECAIDATAGNGHDTQFLCECVGADGIVYAFDIQQQAIDATRERLAASDHLEGVRLILADHSELGERLPELRGQAGAVMFNLGYLPGGDTTQITRPAKTVRALQAAAELLRPGGMLSIVLYVGHAGGPEEADAVESWLQTLPGTFRCSRERHKARPTAPYWLGIQRV